MRTIAAHTLGCKVNQFDTEAMCELFERAGWTRVSFDEAADVYLINTCTVTGTGDAKSRNIIRRAHRQNPEAAIIAAGCLAQRDSEIASLPGVKLVIGVTRRAEVVSLLEEALASEGALSAVRPLNGAPFEKLTAEKLEGRTRAVIKIQEGCDRYCAYCVIPYVRGPVRSMPLGDVAAEAARLAESGYRELVLTGIHLASYGRGEDYALPEAIRAAAAPEGVARVRLGSLEPKLIDAAFLESAVKIPKLCPQFHLSLQSGCDSVLKRMNRRYTADEYMAALDILRAAFPGCALTTDVLTGFPGETREEARATLDFVERARFARIHVFPYSPRPGTRAADMPDQVPEEEKKRRAGELIALGNKLERAYVQALVGKTEEVLVEEAGEGYTRAYVRVRAGGTPGALRMVRIDSVEGALACGRILDGE